MKGLPPAHLFTLANWWSCPPCKFNTEAWLPLSWTLSTLHQRYKIYLSGSKAKKTSRHPAEFLLFPCASVCGCVNTPRAVCGCVNTPRASHCKRTPWKQTMSYTLGHQHALYLQPRCSISKFDMSYHAASTFWLVQGYAYGPDDRTCGG